MRRLLCATALSGALLLFGAGCSADDPATPAAAPVPVTSGTAAPATSAGAAPAASGNAGAGDAALSGNTEAICRQAAKTGGEAARNIAEDVKLRIDAESAQDPAQVAKVQEKSTRDVENYAYALGDMAKLASDPTLKAALTDMSKQVGAVKGDLLKLDAGRFAKLQDSLGQACGGR